MKFRISFHLVIGFIFSCMAGLAAGQPGRSDGAKTTIPDRPNQPQLASGDSSQAYWPSTYGIHRTAKYSTSIGHLGHLGEQTDPGFEFPRGSGIGYLFSGHLMVGGIRGGDTLVSNASLWYEQPDTIAGEYSVIWGREIFAADATVEDTPALWPFRFEDGAGYLSHMVDTFVTAHGFAGVRYPNFLGDFHRPLGIEITQKSHSVDEAPYRNILLLDYTITNICGDSLGDIYFGLQLDPDAYNAEQPMEGYNDDLVGSQRDLATGAVFDNDGEPTDGAFIAPACVTDAIGIRPVRIWPPVSDTNFNWTFQSYREDFGPRQKGTPDDPYRRFLTGRSGTPVGDAEQYYVLSHPEWDYDQVEVARINADDPVWRDAVEGRRLGLHLGGDMRMIMSVGPVDLAPGQSTRLIFGLFCGELLHVDPNNYVDHLLGGNVDRYRDHLYWGPFRQTADYAAEMAHSVIEPRRQPPTSLELLNLNGSQAKFRWDPWVFPDVIGYRFSIIPLPRTEAERVKPPLTRSATVYTTGRAMLLDGFTPGRLYSVTVAHVTENGEGPQSTPATIGNQNTAYALPAVSTRRSYAFYEPGDTAVVIDWERPADQDVLYYKIYKTLDSTEAAERYRPFVLPADETAPMEPWYHFSQNGQEYCYYQMRAYDSTLDEFTTAYYDTAITEDAWYWISAVPCPGYESPMSDLIQAKPSAPPERDLLVIIGGTMTPVDYSNLDSIRAFYGRVLTGLDHDLYVWSDTLRYADACTGGECVSYEDLARYRTILIEEYANPNILGPERDIYRDMFTRLADAGRNIAYFGIPPGDNAISANMTSDTLTYEPDQFEYRYFGLDSALLRCWRQNYTETGSHDLLAGFNRAIPARRGWPALAFDTSRDCVGNIMDVYFAEDPCLPYTPALRPTSGTDVLYTYGSLFPETSELAGQACGVVNQFRHSLVYCFSFHLWAMEKSGARDLIDRLMDEPEVAPPPQLPVLPSLAQNYPNPFNEGTDIEFYLPRDGHVSLELFNVLGRKVRTLLSSAALRGRRTHRVHWDGKNEAGREVATGLYFYRLTYGQAVQTKKMLLIR